MTTETPCQAGDPEDWFIGRDGLQYPDEPFTATDEEIQAVIVARHWPLDDDGFKRHAAAFVIGQKRRDALIRRRKAKQACFDCPMRLQCLTMSLEKRHPYGTFGGYYEEERRQILDEMAKRQSVLD